MRVGNRDIARIAAAPLQVRHYRALINMFRLADRPAIRLFQYLFRAGEFPQTITVTTPSGPLTLSLYSHDDLLTVNEIFFRGDYATRTQNHDIVVDFGSNIGISAAYFLAYHPKAFLYLFEPLPVNIARLTTQLRAFDTRYCLEPSAVAMQSGTARFGWEPTGRYGGVDRQTGRYIDVNCIGANEALERIILKHGRIDVLKIDIETMEEDIVCNLPPELVAQVKTIFVEARLSQNPHTSTHDLRRYGSITALYRRPSAGMGTPTPRIDA
jgi:FkbM family methyltransferase